MHELKLMDVQKKYKDKEAVRKFNYTFTNGVYGLFIVVQLSRQKFKHFIMNRYL